MSYMVTVMPTQMQLIECAIHNKMKALYSGEKNTQNYCLNKSINTETYKYFV